MPVSCSAAYSLYVHVPWCLKKCPYCDFNSHEVRGAIPEADYLTALRHDLAVVQPLVTDHGIASVFIGGGTPSLLSAAAVCELLSALPLSSAHGKETETTLEANPGAIEAAKFAAFRAAGISRLSLGIQSFDDAKLSALGRIHSADEAKRAAEMALRHFGRVNFDLMYGLPEQTLAEARRDIETAITLGPGHISAYHLTIEPNTAFHHVPPTLPDDDLAADMQVMVEETLAAAGYAHYEISAFARFGEQCQHNLNYWAFGDYLGIGAGAHSKIDNRREARPRHPQDYLADPAMRRWQAIAPADLAGEFMMNALRLIEGFNEALFMQQTGLPLSAIEPALRQAENEGLLARAAGCITPTLLGQRFLNRLIGLFLSS
jgi:oxygen-independent coproporphyrinogen-3 oxidase